MCLSHRGVKSAAFLSKETPWRLPSDMALLQINSTQTWQCIMKKRQWQMWQQLRPWSTMIHFSWLFPQQTWVSHCLPLVWFPSVMMGRVNMEAEDWDYFATALKRRESCSVECVTEIDFVKNTAFSIMTCLYALLQLINLSFGSLYINLSWKSACLFIFTQSVRFFKEAFFLAAAPLVNILAFF